MGKKRVSTKKNIFSQFVGNKKNLRTDVLPTKNQLLRYYLWLEKNNSVSVIVKNVISVWKRAGITTVSPRQVTRMWMKIHRKYRDLAKASKVRSKSGTYKVKVTDFKNEMNQLFDISACKCDRFCSCEVKLSKDVSNFLHDQRGIRMLKLTTDTQQARQDSENDEDSDGYAVEASDYMTDEDSSSIHENNFDHFIIS